MALAFGSVVRMTHDMAGSMNKASAKIATFPGQRVYIARIQVHMTAAPTNPIKVYIGQVGNTTYDTLMVQSGANADWLYLRSGETQPGDTYLVPLDGLILEGDEQIWFEWTRVAEAGTIGMVVQAIQVSG